MEISYLHIYSMQSGTIRQPLNSSDSLIHPMASYCVFSMHYISIGLCMVSFVCITFCVCSTVYIKTGTWFTTPDAGLTVSLYSMIYTFLLFLMSTR